MQLKIKPEFALFFKLDKIQLFGIKRTVLERRVKPQESDLLNLRTALQKVNSYLQEQIAITEKQIFEFTENIEKEKDLEDEKNRGKREKLQKLLNARSKRSL